MTPLGIFITIGISILAFVSHRKWVPICIMAAVCYITQGQVLLVCGLHFTSLRMVLLASFTRIIMNGDLARLALNQVDKSVIIYVCYVGVIYTVGRGDLGALIYAFGFSCDLVLAYFIIRCVIRNYEDLQQFLKTLAWFILPLAALMLAEAITGNNRFSQFGAVASVAEFRNNHYRASGPFRIAITGGTFGATLMPLFVSIYQQSSKVKSYGFLGFLAATVITVSSRASGPFLAYLSGLIALFFWKWRRHIRSARIFFMFGLILLHCVMKAPVWYLIARISDVVGGGGNHRAEIITQALSHIDAWWLAGTDDTGNWMAYSLKIDGTCDITNQFLLVGVRGGIVSMVLFIWIIVVSFSSLGRAMNNQGNDRLLWGLGSALFATVVNFFAVAYFDQVEIVFYLLLAAISSVSFDLIQFRSEREQSAAIIPV